MSLLSDDIDINCDVRAALIVKWTLLKDVIFAFNNVDIIMKALQETSLPIINDSFGHTIQGSGDMTSSYGDVKLGNTIGNDANFNSLSINAITYDEQDTVNEVYNGFVNLLPSDTDGIILEAPSQEGATQTLELDNFI